MGKTIARVTLGVLVVGFFVVVGVFGAWWIPLAAIGSTMVVGGLIRAAI